MCLCFILKLLTPQRNVLEWSSRLEFPWTCLSQNCAGKLVLVLHQLLKAWDRFRSCAFLQYLVQVLYIVNCKVYIFLVGLSIGPTTELHKTSHQFAKIGECQLSLVRCGWVKLAFQSWLSTFSIWHIGCFWPTHTDKWWQGARALEGSSRDHLGPVLLLDGLW
jgi:hypothetical protein